MKTSIKILCMLSLAAILILGTIFSLIHYTERFDQSDQSAPYVVVLGAKLYGESPSPALEERLRTALNYLEAHPQSLVIVSGAMGRGERISEAEAMKRWLLERGIAPERIRMDEHSGNTFENLRNSRTIIAQEKGENRIAISTTGYHQLRAGFLAKRLGLEAIRLPADNPPTERVRAYVREVLAVVKSFLFDHE